MRFLFLFLGILLTVSPAFPSRAQNHCPGQPPPADDIVGRWYFPARQSTIEVYRSEGQYFGKITEVNGPWKKGFATLKGQLVLSSLSYGVNEWSGGELIHPQTGLHFDAALVLKDNQTLIVTVYKGVRWIHKEFMLVRQPVSHSVDLAFEEKSLKK